MSRITDILQRHAWVTSAGPALLFVPMLQTTIGTLHTPPPWGVAEPQRWAVLIAWVMGWVVLPFAVGLWHRRWWWPPLCLGTILASAVSAGATHNAA
jgi:hypothetical protein